ncbi:probable precorrin-4 methylase [Thermoplasma acidophilum]|uniref:Probable precorrin-4 methylase n=1 Tax=Thermoplasma acidophilum (strain ATCC 25905 / DSM 1728 / JCM 9062 / NBRC 15155 / AMRC-C165) TaxID=273075 RepID=Q9HKE2_THEAC|nr:probable precorrin-4 methylase [Thermoplasma acidophilum]
MYIIGAGPGDPDLLTVKARRLIESCDVIIYAGSLVNPEILKLARPGSEIHNSAELNINQIMDIIKDAYERGLDVARIHSGDPHIYGALKDQTSYLEALGIPYEVVPGVSVLTSAAASLGIELTMDGISQAVIIARGSLRIPVPDREQIRKLAEHGSTMVIFTGIHIIDSIVKDLIDGGYSPDTPVGVVYRSTWPDEIVIKGRLSNIATLVHERRIYRTALIIVGDVVDPKFVKHSKLYDPEYVHSFRGVKNGHDR